MHRFYLPPEACRNAPLRLDGCEAHHALQVLRLKPGAPVTVLDGAGQEYRCVVAHVAKDSLTLTVSERITTAPLTGSITLLVAIPKGKIIEDIIQKAVELGAQRIVPLLTERVVTQLDAEGAESKQAKWQTVAIEAIKQCGAAWLPKVETPQTITEFLKRGEAFDLALVGSLQTERRHPGDWLSTFQAQHGRPPQTAAVWIGPEGDFTRPELQVIEAAGVKPITLGPLTLRVETAAIYCLSFLNYELQRQPAQRTY